MENRIILEKLDKKQLIDVFSQFLLDSGFGITEYSSNRNIVKISDGVRKFEIHFILKNIIASGWKDRDDIKRIQISNITNELVTTNRVRTHMLCGITRVEDSYLLIVWNSYLYTKHATNRSCYITNDAILKCFDKKYIMVNEYDQFIWLCDSKHFGLLIRDYINYNYVG